MVGFLERGGGAVDDFKDFLLILDSYSDFGCFVIALLAFLKSLEDKR